MQLRQLAVRSMDTSENHALLDLGKQGKALWKILMKLVLNSVAMALQSVS